MKALRAGHLEIGRGTYGMPKVMVFKGSEAKAKIGRYCSIGPGVVLITGGNHPIEWVSTYPFRAELGMEGAFADGMPSTKGDIVVGNDVWIGSGVTVMSGVRIGDGAVICADSIVTSDVPPYSLAGGVPAKFIKKRFGEEEIAWLLEMKWWDWDEKKILDHVPYLSGPDVQGFI